MPGENVIAVEFRHEGGGPAPPTGRAETPTAGPQTAAPGGLGSQSGKPIQVELTKENQELIGRILRGKATPEEIASLTGATKPGAPPSAGPPSGFTGPPLPPELERFRQRSQFGPFLPPTADPATQYERDALKRFGPPTMRDPSGRPIWDVGRAVPIAQPALDELDAAWAAKNQPSLLNQLGPVLSRFGLGGLGRAATAAGLGGGGGGGAGGGLLGGLLGGGGGAGGGAAGAAGAGGLAAIAGPAALALLLEPVVKGLIAAPFEKVRGAANAAAGALEGLARNDLGGAAHDAAEGLAGFVEKTGVAGMVLAEEIRTVEAIAGAANRVVDAFVRRGRELSGFDARLAGAAAGQDVQRLRDDIREAKVTGDAVARMTRGQTELESLGREIMLLIKSEVVEGLAEILEPLGDIAREVKPIIKTITDANHELGLIRKVVSILPPVIALRILAKLLMFLDNPRKAIFGIGEDAPNSLLQDVFDAARNVPVAPGGAAPAAPPAEQKNGAPLWSQ